MSLKCSSLYLALFKITSPQLLASGNGISSATIAGDVYIHPSAKIHPTAKVINISSSSSILSSAVSIALSYCLYY